MQLTRRDAVRALVTGGVLGGSGVAVSEITATGFPDDDSGPVTETEIATMRAAAEVVYPSEIDVSAGFIETYLRSLDGTRKRRTLETIDQLNTHSRREFGSRFFELRHLSTRESVLRSMGVDRVQSNPVGSLPSRIRYHIVNSLLYVLFTSPRGSELFGIRNPTGYGGGFATYREQLDE